MTTKLTVTITGERKHIDAFVEEVLEFIENIESNYEDEDDGPESIEVRRLDKEEA